MDSGGSGSWKEIEILQLLRHATGLPDYRFQQDFNPYRAWAFGELIDLVQALPLHFKPGTEVMQSATNFSSADGNCGKGGGTELP